MEEYLGHGMTEQMVAGHRAKRVTPQNCRHCEYDRQFPGFEGGGWIQQDNNGPIVSCPVCNDDGSHAPRP